MASSNPEHVQACRAEDSASNNEAHSSESGHSFDIPGNALQQSRHDEVCIVDNTFSNHIVEAKIAHLPTWQLVDAIQDSKDLKTLQRHVNARSEPSYDLEEPDLDLARAILEERIGRQKQYLHTLGNSMSTKQWKAHFSGPGSGDEVYEKYLKQCGHIGTATAPRYTFINHRRVAAFMQPMLSSKLGTISNYEIDLSTEGCNVGTIVITDPHLECLSELGDRFDVDPRILMEHHRDDLDSRDKDVYSLDFCKLDSWAVDRLDSTGVIGSRAQEIVIERPASIDSLILAEALVRITCFRMRDSLLLILIQTPRVPLRERPQEDLKSIAIPVEGQSYSPWAHKFFCEEWNARRFCDLWISTNAEISIGRSHKEAGSGRLSMLTWLLALRSFELKIDRLTSKFRALDHKLIDWPSDAALNQVKERRGQVARMRQDIADVKEHAELRSGLLSRSYERCPSSSIQDEYDWIDGKAAELMPLLNENLHLVIAMISIEQAKRTADQTQIAMDDAQVNRKNSERSTKLAYLAAIYLPLTLATGIFGMNIREIGEKKGPRWWTFILMAAVLTVLTVLFMWLAITRTKYRCREPLERRMASFQEILLVLESVGDR